LIRHHDESTDYLAELLHTMSASNIKRSAGLLGAQSNTRLDRGHYLKVFERLWLIGKNWRKLGVAA
jgi:hypothetical protein